MYYNFLPWGKITGGPNKAIGDFPRFLSEWLKIRTDDRLLKMQVAAGVKVEGGWLYNALILTLTPLNAALRLRCFGKRHKRKRSEKSDKERREGR